MSSPYVMKEMSFGKAIEALKGTFRVAREGWNGKGIFLELQVPDEHSKMTHPYIYIDTTELQTTNEAAPKDRVPWLASQTDMLADDWYVVTPKEVSKPVSDDAMVADTVRDIIANQLGVTIALVEPHIELDAGLGMDSLDKIDVSMQLEDEYKLSIPDDTIPDLKTVQDVIDYIVKRIAE